MIKLSAYYKEILQAIVAGESIQRSHPYSQEWVDVKDLETVISIMYNASDALRIKPRTIIVNGVDVPAPMRTKPGRGSVFYTATMYPLSQLTWTDCEWGNTHLDAGLCHDTPEAAALHWDAMIKPSRING